MITFKGNIKDIVKTFQNELIMTITTNANNIPSEELKGLQESKNGVKVDFAKWREKRSLDSNAYAWVLMDKIAKKLNTTKEEVYKTIIKRKGVFEALPIKNIAVNSFVKKWQSKGLGWVCEIDRASTIPNYTLVLAYFGTSTYDTKEMSDFIDEVVYEAKKQGIQTETPDKIEEMKSLWGTYEK